MLNVIGIVLVVVGPIDAGAPRRRGGDRARARPSGFEPQYLPGSLWGAVCAFGYGTSPLLISLGLGPGGAGGQRGGGAGVLPGGERRGGGAGAAGGGRGYMAGLDGGSGRWFLVPRCSVAFSQLFRYLALAVAPVAVVVPIQRLSVVFRLIFNAAINREHEVFDRWVIVSIFLAVFGAIALSVDTDTLLSALSVPEALRIWLSRPLV